MHVIEIWKITSNSIKTAYEKNWAYRVIKCSSRWSKNIRAMWERNHSNYLQHQFPCQCLVKVIVLAVMFQFSITPSLMHLYHHDIGWVQLGMTEKTLRSQLVHRFPTMLLRAYTPQPFQRSTIHLDLIYVLEQRVDVAVTFPRVVMEIDVLQSWNGQMSNVVMKVLLTI